MKDNLMSIVFGLALTFCMVSVTLFDSNVFDKPEPSPVSLIDGKPNDPNSLHCSHVKVFKANPGISETVIKDDGTLIVINITGATSPVIFNDTQLGPGILCVSVPSYKNNDEDETYYFKSFKED